MAAIIPQEINVLQLVKPIAIVDHDRLIRIFPEAQEAIKDRPDADKILFNNLVRQQRARLVLEGRITNPGGPATHQGNWAMAGFLQPAQHHDLNQMSCMEGGGRAIEPGIPRDGAA